MRSGRTVASLVYSGGPWAAEARGSAEQASSAATRAYTGVHETPTRCQYRLGSCRLWLRRGIRNCRRRVSLAGLRGLRDIEDNPVGGRARVGFVNENPVLGLMYAVQEELEPKLSPTPSIGVIRLICRRRWIAVVP